MKGASAVDEGGAEVDLRFEYDEKTGTALFGYRSEGRRVTINGRGYI